jgi:hypothetical protein
MRTEREEQSEKSTDGAIRTYKGIQNKFTSSGKEEMLSGRDDRRKII